MDRSHLPPDSDNALNSLSRALREGTEAIDEESAAQSSGNITTLSSEATRLLLHDLRVHQIELEMQNQELRRRQAELEALQDRYFNLYEFAPVGYCSVSARGLILKANLAATTMLGVTRVKLVGERISRFIRREDQDVFYSNRKLLLVSGKSQKFELRMVRYDSTPFWAHLEANQIPSVDGSQELHFGLIDITERKAAEARLVIANAELVFQNEEKGKRAAELVIANEELARRTEGLRQSDQSLREAQMIGGVGSFDIDVAKDRWTGTDQLETIYGIDANYARDFKSWTRLIHPDDRHALIAYCLNFRENKSNLDREFRIIRANDGAVRWIHGVGKVLCDASGKVQRIVGTAQDITARLEAEDEVRRSEARHISMVSNISDVIAIIGVDGIVKYRSPNIEKWFGWQPQDLAGANGWLTVHPDDLKRIREKFLALLETDNSTATMEYRFKCKDGSYKQIELHATNRVNDPAIGGVLMNYHDITESKAIQVQIAVAKDAAEAANLAKSRFLAAMSHEIRTPMNGILGMAQVLLMPNLSEAERLDYARTILGSGQTLLTLLNDILDLSKIEAGKIELESIALEPGRVIGETQGLFTEIARAKGLRIQTDWSGAPGRYLGDPHRLRQMLSNMVGNAVKFTEQGYVRIEAREVARDAGAAVLEFSVADTGIGIAQDEQALLFLPFSQADSSITRNYGGSGLGLSIVASMARLMGGEVGMQSEAGRGSRFWFRIRAGLPAADADSGEARPYPGDGARSGAIAARLSGRVLVVEDEPDNRKVVSLLLHKLGLGVALAEDGQQALEAIAGGEAADLILMDVHMPRMDGHAATAAIRRREQETGAPRRPIVALTADAFDENRRRCLAAGMDDILTKPIDFLALRTALARWLPVAADASAAVAPAAPAARKPVDIARVSALVGEILPLLALNKFNAIVRFRGLQEILAGTHLAAEMDETGRLLEAMHFDLALERLRGMAAAYVWEKTA